MDLPRKYKPPFQVKITCGEHQMHSKKSTPPGHDQLTSEVLDFDDTKNLEDMSTYAIIYIYVYVYTF